MKTLILSLLLFLIPHFYFCQTPGGVSSGLTSWFKSDNASSITGSPISSWSSSGGSSGISMTQSTSSKRPTLLSAAASKLWSYMSPIAFNASSQTFLGNSSLPSDIIGSTGVIFLISDMDNTSITGLSYSSGNNRFQFKPSFRIQTSNNGVTGYTYDFSLPNNITSSTASQLVCFGAGSNQSIDINSVQTTTCSNCNLALYTPALSSGLFIGSNSGVGEYSNNKIAEVITYNNSLTTAQINKIETYLSIKYGITRGGNTGTSSTYNYIASDGSIVFDKSINTGYNNDIAGIGRDDASGLNKKQSISVNTSDPVTIGLSFIAANNDANNSTFTNDLSFLVWGNNSLPCVSNYSTTTSGLPIGVQARLQRIWKAQATNFGGIGGTNTYSKAQASPLVTVGFETSLLTAYTPISNLRLLMDDDGVNWSNATVVSGAILNGTKVQFSNIQFSSTQKYFTLSTINYATTPLPVELTSFNAYCDANKVGLIWQTATETNNKYFSIEKSADAINWKTVDIIPGHGTSGHTNNYYYTDLNSDSNINYYRLKQTNFDGASKYYNLITYSEGCFTEEMHFKIYPNPGYEKVYISGFMVEKIEITDNYGRLLIEQNTHPTEKLNELNISFLSEGVYFVKIYTPTSTSVEKFIKD